MSGRRSLPPWESWLLKAFDLAARAVLAGIEVRIEFDGFFPDCSGTVTIDQEERPFDESFRLFVILENETIARGLAA